MRKVVVSVGPLASASATKIATAQRPYAAGSLALIGAASDAVSTTVCASQAPVAAAFTINGTQASGGVAYLKSTSYIYITSSGDDHTRTCAIVGVDGNGTSVSETVTLTNAQSVSSAKTYYKIISITPSGAIAANVTVGSYTRATLDTARRVLLTTTADETGNTITLYGTNWAGDLISETITGVNNTTAYSVLDYLSIYKATVSAAAAGNISLGTNGVASSPWVEFDMWAPAPTSIQCTVSGTVNYTVQQTLDNPNSPTSPVTPANVTWINHADTNLVSATTSVQGNYAYVPVLSRVLLNSESGTGNVTASYLQASNGPA